jgi:hypothetical protein
MKPFGLLKIPMMLVGIGAVLLLAPSCKAQSEVSPDHFDGADSWEIAARRPVALKAKPATLNTLYPAQNKKNGADANIQLAAAREVTKVSRRNSVALEDKRKVVARKADPK